MLERFRGLWGRLMSPGAKLLARLGVKPDAVTWTGSILAVAVALIFIPLGWLWQAALILTLLVLTDGLDGQLARSTGQVTPFGAFLDSTLDRVVDGAVFGAAVLWLAQRPGEFAWALIGVWALIMGQVTSYAKARGESVGYRVVGGLAARADRLLIVLAGLLLTGLGVSMALGVALTILAILGTITVGQRIEQVRRQSREAVDAGPDNG